MMLSQSDPLRLAGGLLKVTQLGDLSRLLRLAPDPSTWTYMLSMASQDTIRLEDPWDIL